MKTLLYGTLFLISTGIATAQEWVEKMQQPNANFYDIQKSFNEYWKDKNINEKGKGYKVFKRWEDFVERRVYPNGNLSQLNLNGRNFQDFLKQSENNSLGSGNNINGKFNNANTMSSSTWTSMGPMGPISGTTSGGQQLKSGRLTFLTIDPTNSNNFWTGSPSGGLWKSTNAGVTWSTNTDQLPVTGCSDLAIDPSNTNIMYLATGDQLFSSSDPNNSIGVLKTTDGGITWSSTGLAFPLSMYFNMRRLIINPVNPQILIAATNYGVYRTADAGATWTNVAVGFNCYDLEFKIGNPNIVFASGPTFRRSIDGGATWSVISSGITTVGVNRMAIAVTPADPNFVYVVASESSQSGLQAIYRSNDGGSNFFTMTTSPNLLHNSNNGVGTGGQGWYDLCIAASPLDKYDVVVGGINVWRSTNGGVTWSIYSHWTGSGAPFSHADHHDLEFDAIGTLYDINDGTIYRRTGANWQEISGTMNISRIYKMGLSSLTPDKWLIGTQDNGTSLLSGGTYTACFGGDGMDCFIDRTNDNNMFGETQNGFINKSTDMGVTWASCNNGLPNPFTFPRPWVTIWKQDPQAPSRLYLGIQNLYVSNDQAGNWSQLTAFPGNPNGVVTEFAIAPSNNQIIYVLHSSGIYKTTDAGTTWSNITGTIPLGSAFPTNIMVSPTNPNKAWIVCGNYSLGNKVFMTTNGGATWTNYSANLPNIPGNCLVYEPGSNDRIYVGMDMGIYYRDNTQNYWALYNNGLPNVFAFDMEISPAMPGKIVVATFGRGVWKTDLVPTTSQPVSSFAFANGVCAGVPQTCFDNSIYNPTSWSWSVTPSAGVTINSATSQNPIFTFTNIGTYVVAMTASNTNGPGDTYTQSITVTQIPTITVVASSNSICAGSPVTFTASGAYTYNWACPTNSVCTYLPASNTTYTFGGSNYMGCTSNATISVSVIPNTLNSTASNTIVCSSQAATLTASGASSYTWEPGSIIANPIVVTPTVNTTYIVTGLSGLCNFMDTIYLATGVSPIVGASTTDWMLCSGNAATLTANGATTYSWSTGSTNLSIVVTPTASTTYTVIGFDGGCSAAYTIAQNVAVCTGIIQLGNGDNSFGVYPNPFNDEIKLTSQKEVEVTLFNSLGQMQKQIKFKNQATLQTADLPCGVYMVFVKDENGIRTVKLIKS